MPQASSRSAPIWKRPKPRQSVNEVMAVKKQIAEDLAGNLLAGFSLSGDAKDSTRYTVGFSAFSPSLTKEVYAADSGSQKDAYLAYVQKLFEIGGADAQSAAADAQRIWEMEKELSTHALDRQDQGNVDLTYNVYTMDELKALFPTLDLDDIYAQSGLARSDNQIIVSDVGLLEASPSILPRPISMTSRHTCACPSSLLWRLSQPRLPGRGKHLSKGLPRHLGYAE